MAEYVEVMKQKKRMCNSIRCYKCDIFHLCGEEIGNCPQFISNNPSEAEKIIMAWAAEHLEPVYPSWKEWLISMGVVIEREVGTTIELPDGSFREIDKDTYTFMNWDKPIPADIAQRLGVEPKEDV